MRPVRSTPTLGMSVCPSTPTPTSTFTTWTTSISTKVQIAWTIESVPWNKMIESGKIFEKYLRLTSMMTRSE